MMSFSSPAPPPYSPLRTPPPHYTQKSSPYISRRGSRCTKSESWVPRDNNIDNDDFLVNLAAIQLLTGCTVLPGRHVISGTHRSIDIYSGDDDGSPDLTLHMFATLNVPARRRARSTARSKTRRYSLRDTLGNEVDGHISYPSDESARRFAKANSAPTTPSSHDQVGSEELDRRLRTIDEALDQENSRRGSRRLHTSEVVRVDRPEANENDSALKSVGKVSAALAAWKYSQHRDLSHRSGVLYPSPVLSEMAYSSQSTSEVCFSTSTPQILCAPPIAK